MKTHQSHQFVPIEVGFECGASLIKQVFGRDFYVEDENGQALTTLRNKRLFGYAKQIVEGVDNGSQNHYPDELSRLGRLADVVKPTDYHRARERDIAAAPWSMWEFGHAESAGALE